MGAKVLVKRRRVLTLAKDRNRTKVKEVLLLWQKDVGFQAASFIESVTATFKVEGF